MTDDTVNVRLDARGLHCPLHRAAVEGVDVGGQEPVAHSPGLLVSHLGQRGIGRTLGAFDVHRPAMTNEDEFHGGTS